MTLEQGARSMVAETRRGGSDGWLLNPRGSDMREEMIYADAMHGAERAGLEGGHSSGGWRARDAVGREGVTKMEAGDGLQTPCVHSS